MPIKACNAGNILHLILRILSMIFLKFLNNIVINKNPTRMDS